MNIAVDGPAGAGKSSIAKLVAKQLGIVYVDTGAMYRTMALACIRSGVDLDDENAVTNHIQEIEIRLGYENGNQKVYLADEDVSTAIRQEEVGNGASKVARFTAVREKLVALQQDMAKRQDVIMDGRDIGTVVLPDAELKIYLTASSKVRAERRYKELVEKGETPNIDDIERDIIARDEQDMNREVSPLRKADDAIEVDTSDMSIDQVVATITDLVNRS